MNEFFLNVALVIGLGVLGALTQRRGSGASVQARLKDALNGGGKRATDEMRMVEQRTDNIRDERIDGNAKDIRLVHEYVLALNRRVDTEVLISQEFRARSEQRHGELSDKVGFLQELAESLNQKVDLLVKGRVS